MPREIPPLLGWLRRPETVRLLRIEALTVSVIGLAFFVAAAVIAPQLGWESSGLTLVWKVGLVMTAVGCLWLCGLIAWVYRRGQRVMAETVIGFLSILVAMLCLLAAIGNEEGGIKVFWLVMAVILIPSSMALIMLSALASRKPGSG